MRLGVVDQIEGDVLLVEPGQARGHLVVLTLGLGGDGHGVAGLGHFDAGELPFVLGVADRVAGFPVHLAHGHDVAAAGFLDLAGLFAADGIQAAQLVSAGGADISQGHVGGDSAAHELHEAVFAELVGNGFENKAQRGGGGVNALGLGRVGHIVQHALEEGLGADILHGGAGKDGDHAPVLHTGFHAQGHVGLGQLHGVEEFLHQLLGGAGGSLHEGHAQLFHPVLIRRGDGDLGGLAGLGLVGGVMDQVDNAAAVAHGDGDGADDAAVLGLQRVQRGEVVAVLLVALGDAEHNGQVRGLEIFPGALHADSDPVLGGADDNARLNGAKGAEHVSHKVKKAGAVQNVYLAAVEAHRGYGGGDADLTLDLLGVIIADGVSVADLSLAVKGAGGKQHALRKAGLAAVAMAHQADVANVFGFHLLLPLCQVYM